HADEPLGQLGRHVMGLVIEDVEEGQALHLPRRRLDQALLAEAERGAPEAGQPFDILLPVLVIDMDALALGDHQRAFALMLLQMSVGMEMKRDVAARSRIATQHGASFSAVSPNIRPRRQLSQTCRPGRAVAPASGPRQPVAARPLTL